MKKSKETDDSKLSFTGKSATGHLKEAVTNALEQAVNAVPDGDKLGSGWTIEEIGGNKLEAEPLFVKIRIHPGEGEQGGIGPRFT